MLKCRQIILFILISLAANAVYAGGIGTGGSDFLKILPGIRSAGMGGSGIALGLDADSIWLNPAALYLKPEKKQFYYSHLDWWESVDYEYVAYVHGIDRIGVFGGSFSFLHMPEFELTNVYGIPTGEILSIYDIMLDLAYGGKIKNGLYWGINVKSIRRKLGDYDSHGYSSDLGFVYRIKLKRNSGDSIKYSYLNFAAVFQNIMGTGIVFNDPDDRDNFPVVIKLGAAYRPARNVSFAVDIDIPDDGGIKLHAGIEDWLSKKFCLRAGYDGMDDFYLPSGVCLGFSLNPNLRVDYNSNKAKKISKYFLTQIDYALRMTGDMGIVQRIALRMDFESGKKERKRSKKKVVSTSG